MKTNTLLLSFLFIPVFLFQSGSLFSQSAPGFSYQAVVRGADKTPLANQEVGFRFGILDAGQEVVYSESRLLTTNDMGIVNAVIGESDPSTFLSIDWSSGGYSLKVEIDPEGGTSYSLMETKVLQSSPYALFALSGNEGPQGPAGPQGPQGPEGPPGPAQWGEEGEYLNSNGRSVRVSSKLAEEALFEVLREDGQPVFSVYRDGIRMQVEDYIPKGSKGGFAVGGFSPGKERIPEFLFVTPDSIRLNIGFREEGKGSKGGFAVGGFNPAKQAEQNYIYINPQNIHIGLGTGSDDSRYKNNIIIGNNIGLEEKESNRMHIGMGEYGPLIYGEFDKRYAVINGTLEITEGIIEPSDLRYKRDIESITGALDLINGLNGIYYQWDAENHPGKHFPEKRQIGLIAQEAENILPEVVSRNSEGYLGIDYGKITPLLIQAIKEQQQQIDFLREENRELADLKEQVRQLQKALEVTATEGNR